VYSTIFANRRHLNCSLRIRRERRHRRLSFRQDVSQRVRRTIKKTQLEISRPDSYLIRYTFFVPLFCLYTDSFLIGVLKFSLLLLSNIIILLIFPPTVNRKTTTCFLIYICIYIYRNIFQFQTSTINSITNLPHTLNTITLTIIVIVVIIIVK